MLDDTMAFLAEDERQVLADLLERMKARLQSMGPNAAGTDAAIAPAAPR
jgi:hypothetical protein